MTPPLETLRPFVPAKDLAVSLRFHCALGFEIRREFSDGSGAIHASRFWMNAVRFFNSPISPVRMSASTV